MPVGQAVQTPEPAVLYLPAWQSEQPVVLPPALQTQSKSDVPQAIELESVLNIKLLKAGDQMHPKARVS